MNKLMQDECNSLSTTSTFPKSRRLLKRFDFMRVLKNGSRVSDSQLSFAVHANEQGEARLGLAIAKKAVPHAVDRNAIKRQIREAFRVYADLPSMDIVALTRRSTVAQDVQLTRKSAENLFKRIAEGKVKPPRKTTKRS